MISSTETNESNLQPKQNHNRIEPKLQKLKSKTCVMALNRLTEWKIEGNKLKKTL